MSEQKLELSPNEQLAEIARRTTDEGYVEVDFVEWKKLENSNSVRITFESVDRLHTAVYDWPDAYDTSNEFVAIIEEETPYTMMTADQINDDDEITLLADSSDWSLVGVDSTEQRLRDKLSFDMGEITGKIVGFVLLPLTVVYQGLTYMGGMDVKGDVFLDFPEDSVVDSEEQLIAYANFVKGALAQLLWIVVVVLLFGVF